MDYTQNYQLREPGIATDPADVRDLNFNFRLIDELIHNTQTALAPAYDQLTSYQPGDLAMYDLKLYKCITATTGNWDEHAWTLATLGEVIDLLRNEVTGILDGIAQPYDPAETYDAGAVVNYDASFWACNTDGTTGAWDPQYWDACVIAEHLGEGGQELPLVVVDGLLCVKYQI